MDQLIKENLIVKLSFDFSIKIVRLYKMLLAEKEFVISKQLLRSATSIGANIEEAMGAFSKKDFLYKMSLSYKEGKETRYWLKLLKESELTEIDVSQYLLDIDNINNVLTKIIKTTRMNLGLHS